MINQEFELNVYFSPQEVRPYMRVHDRYTYDQLGDIFDNTDVLVVPSIWNETFGYTVLEAMSYGVPVIVSDHVGAKDVIPDGCGIVIKNIDKDKLRDAIGGLKSTNLQRINQNILDKVEIRTLEQMTDEIVNRCY